MRQGRRLGGGSLWSNERYRRPLLSSVSRTIESAPVRSGVEQLRIATAHDNRAHIQRRQSLIAGLPGFSSIARLKDTARSPDVKNVGIGRMQDQGTDELFRKSLSDLFPVFRPVRASKQSLG